MTDEVHWCLSRAGTGSRCEPRSESANTLLRELVESTDWTVWRGVERDERGRPRLRDAVDIDVSISYSGDWTMVAVARGIRVGVDVELVTPVFDRSVLLRSACTSSEAAALRALSGATRRSALADLWTLKEAAVKAHGAGLSADLRRVDASKIHALRVCSGASGLSACVVVQPRGARRSNRGTSKDTMARIQ